MESKSGKLIYARLEEIDAEELRLLLNENRIREHLVEHKLFDSDSVKAWIKEKIDVNSESGCRVRGIMSNDCLAGWCGIQLENGRYEIALVLGSQHWGIGKQVFNDMMHWAEQLGHEDVFIHLLDTRPEYKFLRKISKKMFHSQQHGRKFTTYQVPVKKGLTTR